MLKKKLEDEIRTALQELFEQGPLSALNVERLNSLLVKVERSKKNEFGDFSTGLALQIAAITEIPAMDLADQIAARLRLRLQSFAELSVSSPGFLNFKLAEQTLLNVLQSVHLNYADSLEEQECRILAERTNIDEKSFQIQYTHICCCGLLKALTEPLLNCLDQREDEALINKMHWQESIGAFKNSTVIFELLFADADEKLNSCMRDLLIMLDSFESTLARAHRIGDVKLMLSYSLSLSQMITQFCSFLQPARQKLDVLTARVGLLLAAKIILANAIKAAGSLPASRF